MPNQTVKAAESFNLDEFIESLDAEAAKQFDKDCFNFATMALANNAVWEVTRAALIQVRPELVHGTLRKIDEIAIARQHTRLVSFLKNKETRDGRFTRTDEGKQTFRDLQEELLVCLNRANAIGEMILETKEVNSVGAGGGKKLQRRAQFEVADEFVLDFKVSKKIQTIQLQEEGSE